MPKRRIVSMSKRPIGDTQGPIHPIENLTTRAKCGPLSTMKIPTHDGKGTIKFWGVRYVPEKRAIKKKFYRRDGTLDERLYAHETEQDFRRLEFDDGTPSLIENRRAAHYRAYVYILGKVWH